MLKYCVTCFIIAVILFMGFVLYCCCVLAGRADRAMDSFTATAEEQKKIERCNIIKAHECRWVKHYNHKLECYVDRCSVCKRMRPRYKRSGSSGKNS